MLLARCMYWLLIFLLPHPPRLADAGRCEGRANSEALGSQVCAKFPNETSCNDGFDSLCRWEMERDGCIVVVPSFSCSELMFDNPEDCNNIEGCYWTEIPVWVWSAINIPLWLLIAGVCLICYHKHVGNSRIQVYDREESITIISDSISQVTEEQERTQDAFGNPIPPVVYSKAISESEASSNEKSVFEMEDGAVIMLEKGTCDDKYYSRQPDADKSHPTPCNL